MWMKLTSSRMLWSSEAREIFTGKGAFFLEGLDIGLRFFWRVWT